MGSNNALILCPSSCRYLVLDYVAGGELFDYLVKRVRLPEREVDHPC